MEKKIRLKNCGILFLCFAFILSLALKPELVSAKSQKILSGSFFMIDGYYYDFEWGTSQGNKDIVKRSVDDSSKETSIVKDVTSWNIVTNGKTVYYSKDKADKGIIYKMDIKSKKATKVLSGKKYVLLGGTDKYLYIGRTIGPVGIKYADKVYIYNIKTKKMKERKFSEYLMKFQVKNNRVMAMGAHSDTSNALMEIMTDSGKSIFKTKAVSGMLLWESLVYQQEYYADNMQKFRYYECDPNGKNKKKITYNEFDAYFRHPHLTYGE